MMDHTSSEPFSNNHPHNKPRTGPSGLVDEMSASGKIGLHLYPQLRHSEDITSNNLATCLAVSELVSPVSVYCKLCLWLLSLLFWSLNTLYSFDQFTYRGFHEMDTAKSVHCHIFSVKRHDFMRTWWILGRRICATICSVNIFGIEKLYCFVVLMSVLYVSLY